MYYTINNIMTPFLLIYHDNDYDEVHCIQYSTITIIEAPNVSKYNDTPCLSYSIITNRKA